MITYTFLGKRLFSFCFYVISKNRNLLQAKGPCYSLASSLSNPRSYTSLQAKLIFLNNDHTKSIISRHKSKSKKNKFGYKDDDNQSDEDESDDDDDDDGDDDKLKEKGIEIKTFHLPSLRIDLVLKTVLGYNRSQIEKSFYKTKIRINGRLLLKKGAAVKVGDEVDIIKGFASENPDFLIVGRVEILKIGADAENKNFLIKVKKSKTLLIDNYSDADRWKFQESEMEA